MAEVTSSESSVWRLITELVTVWRVSKQEISGMLRVY